MTTPTRSRFASCPKCGYADGQDAIPTVSWDEFVGRWFKWKQSQHVGMIGPTGSGKTSLSQQLLPMRKFVVATGTKPRDDNLERLVQRDGYKRMEEWQPGLSPELFPKRLLWPDASELDSLQTQREAFQSAFAQIYREGGWCLYIDELWYFAQMLNMNTTMKMFLQQSRSNEISFLGLTQRPAWVPLELYDNSEHLFFWADSDETNLKRISGISSLSSRLIQQTVSSLERYQVLYINTKGDRIMVKTTPPPPEE